MSRVVIASVCKVSSSQAAGIDALINQLATPYPRTVTQLDVSRIAKTPGNTLFIAIDEQERVIGMLLLTTLAAVTGNKVWIEDFVVDARQRGAGVGAQLLDTAVLYARSKGVTHINLTVRSERAEATKLYARAGFRLNDTNYYRLTLIEPGAAVA